MAIDLQSALDRLCAIEKEALAALSPAVTADAIPYMIHSQEAFPYFTHRVAPILVESDSQDIDLYEVEIVIRLVIGHVTEGYNSQPEDQLYAYLPAVMHAINARELLQSATYTTALTGLIEARATSSTGLTVFQTAGIPTQQVGAQISVVCTYADDLTQLYL